MTDRTMSEDLVRKISWVSLLSRKMCGQYRRYSMRDCKLETESKKWARIQSSLMSANYIRLPKYIIAREWQSIEIYFFLPIVFGLGHIPSYYHGNSNCYGRMLYLKPYIGIGSWHAYFFLKFVNLNPQSLLHGKEQTAQSSEFTLSFNLLGGYGGFVPRQWLQKSGQQSDTVRLQNRSQ